MPIRPFSRCQVEKAKPELLQPALTDAMSHFVSEVQDGLAPSSPNRRIAVQHTAAASRRNLERGDVERDLARDGGATRSIPGSMWSKLVSYARRGRWRIHPATPELPDRWMLIWSMLISDPDDAMRGVARQAFADNPQRILNHARWLAEHLQSNTENSWSTAKTEVLRLFATLQALPPTLPASTITTGASASSSSPPLSSIYCSTPCPRPLCRRSQTSFRWKAATLWWPLW